MLNRLPIALAQLQAGNNSNKLENEIRPTTIFTLSFKKYD